MQARFSKEGLVLFIWDTDKRTRRNNSAEKKDYKAYSKADYRSNGRAFWQGYVEVDKEWIQDR